MDIVSLIQGGTKSSWIIASLALLIGGLHGLEPGHSKTMIAAYIIAIKGSVTQAFLLGLSAAVSHSIIVWVLAFIALSYGNELIGEQLEPWFILLSGLMIVGLAMWMARGFLPLGQRGRRSRGDHPHVCSHQDAHTTAHVAQIEKSLSKGLGNWQTILFGLTGGLVPCPAAITVFILCMNLGKASMGIALVGAFSVGLALVLIAVGVVTAYSARLVSSRMNRLTASFAAYAPILSVVLVAAIGLALTGSSIMRLR